MSMGGKGYISTSHQDPTGLLAALPRQSREALDIGPHEDGVKQASIAAVIPGPAAEDAALEEHARQGEQWHVEEIDRCVDAREDGAVRDEMHRAVRATRGRDSEASADAACDIHLRPSLIAACCILLVHGRRAHELVALDASGEPAFNTRQM